MHYYAYDTKHCNLLYEIAESEVTETSVKSFEQFDLNLYDVFVGYLDSNRCIKRYTKIIRDTEALLAELKKNEETIVNLDDQVTSLQLALVELYEAQGV